jgi:carboxynorspermidine decarboxylase
VTIENLAGIKRRLPRTPVFLYDESRILRQLGLLAAIREQSGARILYSIKALPFTGVLDLVRPRVDGFSASSLFEARLASEVLRRPASGTSRRGSLHITTPGLRADEIGELARLCDCISFNSLEQGRRLLPRIEGRTSLGFRVNPRLSFLDDRRYDPCRPFSKLGVPIDDLAAALAADTALAARIDGLHFHTLFESRSFDPLRETLARIENSLGGVMDGLRWINLGGGYLVETEAEARELAGVIRDVKRRRAVEVFFEPGKAIVGQAGFLVASVIDRFERDGKAIAVLDTGVHHLPEVFEYQKPPMLAEHRPEGAFECLLAGCTCLAGDVLGEYRFDAPLSVGDRLVFENVGAYSLIKASRFNGYDLPTIYALRRNGRIEVVKHFGYEDYREQWTADVSPIAGDESGV